ncbi:hypothetical protein OMCYN_01787 [cyanobiont of Ornithocercus magnificus]|nr:hypothetical protein OMCYN_01787 [cyanobiont of Ornithocercus magnificus]
MKPIEHRLDQAFESEKLSRFIRECRDIETLQQTALSLLARLAQERAAKNFLAMQAAESENEKLKLLATIIRSSNDDKPRPLDLKQNNLFE